METSTVTKHHHEAGRGKALARRYDYVIVGAGSAGCVVARRLLDGTDATVLLLEAGGPGEDAASLSNPPQWVENIGSRYDWAYHYEPSPHVAGRSIPLPLGKVLGGSGSINAMVWTRGHRADYDGWAEAGNRFWDFISVLPLFKQSEDWEDGASAFRGAGGPIRVERARDLHPVAAAFIAAGRSCGMPYLDDLNVPEPEGVGPMNLNIKGGRRCSPADAYLRPVMGNRNLTVLTEAPAVKLTLTGTQCTGVEFLLDGELCSVGASREVILCAGAIHTPRLLLLSGVGSHADLEPLGIDTVIASVVHDPSAWQTAPASGVLPGPRRERPALSRRPRLQCRLSPGLWDGRQPGRGSTTSIDRKAAPKGLSPSRAARGRTVVARTLEVCCQAARTAGCSLSPGLGTTASLGWPPLTLTTPMGSTSGRRAARGTRGRCMSRRGCGGRSAPDAWSCRTSP